MEVLLELENYLCTVQAAFLKSCSDVATGDEHLLPAQNSLFRLRSNL